MPTCARRKLAIAVGGAILLLILVGAGGAAVCGFAPIDCGLNPFTPSEELFEEATPETEGPNLAEGFSFETVASSLSLPTSFAFLPDGRILVAEKDGIVKLFEDGVSASTPFLDIRAQVNTFDLQGLLDVEVDPDYPQTPALYVLYAFRDTSQPEDGASTVRVSRFTVDDDVAVSQSEEIVLGAESEGSCEAKPVTSDCIPVEGRGHAGGDITFDRNGTMFVATGDGAHADAEGTRNALRAQNIDSLAGKILRVTRDGDALSDNPFWNGDPGANRSKVWALGLRNPFRFALEPNAELALIGDVGWFDWEEVNAGGPAANYGWPCYEGPEMVAVYEDWQVCRELYAEGDSAVEFPLLAHSHSDDGQSVTGGVVYGGEDYPPEYRNTYIYGDWARGWVRAVRIDGAMSEPRVVAELATRAGGPVDFGIGPEGDLYYLALNAGELRRLVYNGP